MSDATQAAQQRSAAWSQENEQGDNLHQVMQGSQYDPNNLYGSYPGYGPQGVMPPKEGGFEEYVAHHLGMANFIQGAGKQVIKDGPYQGLSKGEAYEKMRDDYASLSPEQRSPWEQRTFLQNDRSQGEHLFQYPSQEKAWGPTGPSYREQGIKHNQSGIASEQQNQDRDRLVQAGRLGSNQTISDPNKFSAAVANLDADPRNVSAQNSGGIRNDPSFQPQGRINGLPAGRASDDTTRFGPKLSGGGNQSVTSWTAPTNISSGGIRNAPVVQPAAAQTGLISHPNYDASTQPTSLSYRSLPANQAHKMTAPSFSKPSLPAAASPAPIQTPSIYVAPSFQNTPAQNSPLQSHDYLGMNPASSVGAFASDYVNNVANKAKDFGTNTLNFGRDLAVNTQNRIGAGVTNLGRAGLAVGSDINKAFTQPIRSTINQIPGMISQLTNSPSYQPQKPIKPIPNR